MPLQPNAPAAPAAKPPRAQCYTYFIQHDGGGPIKIGKTRNVKARIKMFQCGCPKLVRLVGIIAGDAELFLHDHFDCYRIPGSEWFHPSPALVKYVKSLRAEAPDVGVKLRGVIAGRKKEWFTPAQMAQFPKYVPAAARSEGGGI